MERRCSLFAGIESVGMVRDRLHAMGCSNQEETTIEHQTIYTFKYDNNGQPPRPYLRVIESSQSSPIKIVHISPPDTNAARKTTVETVLEIQCASAVDNVKAFLADTRYSFHKEMKCTFTRYRGIMNCTLEIVQFDDQSGFIRLCSSVTETTTIKTVEDRLLRVASMFKDVCLFEHVDNALLKP